MLVMLFVIVVVSIRRVRELVKIYAPADADRSFQEGDDPPENRN